MGTSILQLLLALIFIPHMLEGKCLNSNKFIPPPFHEEATTKVTIDVTNSVTSQLLSHILKIFLEEGLAYKSVVLQQLPEPYTIQDMIKRIDNETHPQAMVNLEAWVPVDLNLASILEQGEVKDGGDIGPPGRFGWFIPQNGYSPPNGVDSWKFFTKQDGAIGFFEPPEDTLKYIEKFKLNFNSSLYCKKLCDNGMFIPERCGSLRHKSQPCALLISDFVAETEFVVDHIIENKMYVKVIWVGEHLKDVVSAVMKDYADKSINKSLLILTKIPSPVMSSLKNFITVSFPYCNTLINSSSNNCKYLPQRRAKLVWAPAEKTLKLAETTISKMLVPTRNTQLLLNLYNNETFERNLSRIACHWLNTSYHIWRNWVPTSSEFDKDMKKLLYIGGLFPLSNDTNTFNGRGIFRASFSAVHAINANPSVLEKYRLNLLANHGGCEGEIIVKHFLDYILNHYFKSLVGILGPACSDAVEPLAGISRIFHTVVISYSAEGSSFSDRRKYPYFFRTIGENKQFLYVYLQIFKKFGWKRITALTEDGQKYTEYISIMQDYLLEHDIHMVNRKFPRDREKDSMGKYLEELKRKRAKIIICDVYDSIARSIMCEAYKRGMTAKDGYVWFLPHWLTSDWYDTSKYPSDDIHCSKEEMEEALNGHFALGHAYFAPDDAIMQENITVREWKEKYVEAAKGDQSKISNYAGYAYDAIWTYALALDRLFKANDSLISQIHEENATDMFVQELNNIDFNGLSGRVKFFNGTRISVINVVQWLKNSTKIIATLTPSSITSGMSESYLNSSIESDAHGMFELNTSAIRWLSSDGKTPDDGAEPPPVCLVQNLADLLNLDCEMAVVVANVIGFGLLGILLIVGFLFLKRRYDMKVKSERDALMMMKTLGLDLLEPRKSDLDKWEIPRDHVVINRKLGEGAFGTVYGGEAHFSDKGWVAVAVKTLKVGSTTEEKLDFLSEAEVMKRFDHKNVVKLLGVCTKNEPVYTVMEFMLYGDLKTFLLARRHLVNDRIGEEADEISSKKLTQMALDVAKALSYLAELKYVHRDVASRNCLVNSTRVVKLGDFGMTRLMFENDYYKFSRKGMLPVRWMAPESLALGIFTPASDVWSYGVLLYEIITFGSFPFQGLSNNEVLNEVKAGKTLAIPLGVKSQLKALMRSCWDIEYKKRPQASAIVDFLANNPRLISPCLDVPLASVQMEDTGQLEMQLPDRKSSMSMSFKTSNSGLCPRNRSMSETAEVLTRQAHPRELNYLPEGNLEGHLLDSENGPTGVREPLLGTSRSSSSMGLTKYVTLQRRPSGGNIQCVDYDSNEQSTSLV